MDADLYHAATDPPGPRGARPPAVQLHHGRVRGAEQPLQLHPQEEALQRRHVQRPGRLPAAVLVRGGGRVLSVQGHDSGQGHEDPGHIQTRQQCPVEQFPGKGKVQNLHLIAGPQLPDVLSDRPEQAVQQ